MDWFSVLGSPQLFLPLIVLISVLFEKNPKLRRFEALWGLAIVIALIPLALNDFYSHYIAIDYLVFSLIAGLLAAYHFSRKRFLKQLEGTHPGATRHLS